MKLRNKRTREVVNAVNMTVSTPCEPVLGYEASDQIGEYASLAELNACWEDYKPAEPLIKDEKIRKAVRAWADADGADEKIYLTIDDNGSRFANKYGGYIEFAFQINMEEGLYTIAELCGEGEE